MTKNLGPVQNIFEPDFHWDETKKKEFWIFELKIDRFSETWYFFFQIGEYSEFFLTKLLGIDHYDYVIDWGGST